MPRDRGQPASANPQPGEIYLEFRPVGRTVRVAAVDATTGTEVVVMGPTSASNAELERLAVAKLRAQLAKLGKGRRD